MADKYADLSISERVNKAADLLSQHPDLSVRKASEICDVHHSSVSRGQRGLTKPQKEAQAARQLLTASEEAVLIKFALLYFKWGLPLQIKHLRQFAVEILRHRDCYVDLGNHRHQALLQRNPQVKRVLS
jgi:hypothetical protein